MGALAENLKKLTERLRSIRPWEPGGTVELADESEPDGMVVFRDKRGGVTGYMSRACYEAFLKAANG